MNIVDIFLDGDTVCVWVHPTQCLRYSYTATLYASLNAKETLERHCIPYDVVERSTWKDTVDVCRVRVRPSQFQSTVRLLERVSCNTITLYNADITPEHQFMLDNNFYPGRHVKGVDRMDLSVLHISYDNGPIHNGEPVSYARLAELVDTADIIVMPSAYKMVAMLNDESDVPIPWHRWNASPVTYRGGKSYYSYGRTVYRDHVLTLNGRLLVDSRSTVGSECDVDGILELCKFTCTRFHKAASRSFGSIFQNAITKVMWDDGLLIPYKEKPVDLPLTGVDMLKGDRGGHTFDACVGRHENVVSIDFSSMYPWILYNENVSADTILAGGPPYKKVPGLNIMVSHEKKGIIPRAIKPILDARMQYKQDGNPRAAALKWILVTAYGYLRFREFKLGVASAHMTICAYARHILIETAKMAEANGCTVLHGIIDGLYLQGDVSFIKDVESRFGIPLTVETFDWVTFLPSVSDGRPLPASYYGQRTDGTFKVRGLDMRQYGMCDLVKRFQNTVLQRLHDPFNVLDDVLERYNENELWMTVRIGKEKYKHACVQKKLLKQCNVMPGQTVRYMMTVDGPSIVRGTPDMSYYRKLLLRSFNKMFAHETVRVRYLETRLPDKRKGYSEKVVRRKLERDGWTVFRGGYLHVPRIRNVYPNVLRKYSLVTDERLMYYSYLCGMPDFLCYKNGAWKLVECKLMHEQLSLRQRRCIRRLVQDGYTVEVWKITDSTVRAKRTVYNIVTGENIVKEKQLTFRNIK